MTTNNYYIEEERNLKLEIKLNFIIIDTFINKVSSMISIRISLN